MDIVNVYLLGHYNIDYLIHPADAHLLYYDATTSASKSMLPIM